MVAEDRWLNIEPQLNIKWIAAINDRVVWVHSFEYGRVSMLS